MGYRNYSDEDKAVALAYLEANKGNVTRTSDLTKIPEKTIRNWRDGKGTDEEIRQIADIKKASLADTLEDIAYKIADVLPDKIDEASLKDASTSLGIVIDKMRLLRNEPTVIEDNGRTDLTDDERVARIAALLNAGRERGAGQTPVSEGADAEPTEPA